MVKPQIKIYESKSNKSGEFKMTHQATANRLSLFSSMESVILFTGPCRQRCRAFIYFCDSRTDTMCENNDHPFGRGLVGQLESEWLWYFFAALNLHVTRLFNLLCTLVHVKSQL